MRKRVKMRSGVDKRLIPFGTHQAAPVGILYRRFSLVGAASCGYRYVLMDSRLTASSGV